VDDARHHRLDRLAVADIDLDAQKRFRLTP
jgi:hypothetical protein